MGRKRSLSDEEYSPELEKRMKKRVRNLRRSKAKRKADAKRKSKEAIKKSNDNRKSDAIKKANEDRSPGAIKKANDGRGKKKRVEENKRRNPEAIKKANDARKKKSDHSGLEYDLNSPFPPTLEQADLCGHILSNSIGAAFAQQAPPPEICYSLLMVDELKLYIAPIIEYTIVCFNQECCFKSHGDINFGKASANKALNTLDKLLLFNNHYQLMNDFMVWDMYNPPSLFEVKKLATRHPYQPQSSLIRYEICKHKEKIHQRM